MISIIVATYNQEKLLPQTVQSIYNQTMPVNQIEVIFVNDGSTDNTAKVIEQSITKLEFRGIRASRIETNDVGATNARTEGIRHAHGGFYVPLDGDDLLEPKFLQRTYEAIQNNPKAGFVYTDTTYFGTMNHRFHQPEYNFFNLIFQNYICYASLFTIDAFMHGGGYNLSNRNYYEDWELSIRLGRKGIYGHHLAEPLFKYRTHIDAHSNKVGLMDKVYRAYIVTQYPELYPPNMGEEAAQLMSKLPENFMSLKWEEQNKIYAQFMYAG